MANRSVSRRGFLGAAASLTSLSVAGAAESDAPSPGHLSFTRDIPIGKSYDLVVCGAGPAGMSAALSAARVGLNVLLVDGQGQLGGMGVSGLVSHWLGGRTSDGRRWVVAGLFKQLAEKAIDEGFALLPQREQYGKFHPHGWYGSLIHGVPFDPHHMAAFLDRQMADFGVDTLLATQAVDVQLQGDRITHVVLFNKSGLTAVPARAVVDATGDADLAARSGCAVSSGRDEDGLMTPATLQFHVDHVDQDALSAYIHEQNAPRFRKKILELRDSGEWTFPYEIFISVQLNRPGTMMINTSRLVGVDGTDGQSITDAMIRGREETEKLVSLMRAHFPGCGDVRLKDVAPLLGVRETRRIRGPYILTVDDLVQGEEFDDTIGLSAYGWDLPDPKRPSHQPLSGKVRRKRAVTPIPYRVLLPSPVENLICPGRAISVERDVLGPLRVSAPCFAMGEAAGQAARQVVQSDIPFAQVDTVVLREELLAHDVLLDPTAFDPS